MSAVPVSFDAVGPDDGRLVVLAHSIGTTRDVWTRVAELLAAQGARVVRYDHRGHGASPVPPGPYAMADLAGDLVALLDRLGAATASVAGVSLGGMVAMQTALQAPDRVDRLALVCTGAYLPPQDLWRGRARTARADGMGALAGGILPRWTAPGYAEREPEAHGRLAALLEATPPEGYAAAAEAIAAMDLRADLPSITAPTLVVAGADDVATPAREHGAQLAAAIPDATLEVVAGAAHLAPYERPDEVAALLRRHLLG